MWDVKTWSEVAQLEGHDDEVSCCAWYPNGTQLASASLCKMPLRVWDVSTWTKVAWMAGSRSIAWSPDGTRLASVHGEWEVSVYKAPAPAVTPVPVDDDDDANVATVPDSSLEAALAHVGMWAESTAERSALELAAASTRADLADTRAEVAHARADLADTRTRRLEGDPEALQSAPSRSCASCWMISSALAPPVARADPRRRRRHRRGRHRLPHLPRPPQIHGAQLRMRAQSVVILIYQLASC